jgi:hypothetical protein
VRTWRRRLGQGWTTGKRSSTETDQEGNGGGPIDKKKDRYMDKQKQNSGDESTDQLEQTCSAFWRLELASETQ